MKRLRLIFWVVSVCFVCAPRITSFDLRADDSVIEVGTSKQLMLDDRLLESSHGVRLTMNPPRRDGRLLLVPDEPWEQGFSVQVYSSVLKENGKIRIWYDLFGPPTDEPFRQRRVAYAESEDGLHFTKPHLGLHEIDGSTSNNIVLPGMIGGCSVWVDPRASAEHRYKTQAKVYPSGEFHMHSSPDGLRWKLFAKQQLGPGGHDTQSIVFWDNNVGRYVMFTRSWTTPDGPRIRRIRRVRRLESGDLQSVWENERVVMAPDSVDWAHPATGERPPVDYYGACVFPYEENPNVYIMLTQAFWDWKVRSSFDVRLAFSRDGTHFQRLGNWRPFMANGSDGSFDSQFVWAMPNPIRMGDEIWIYYVGSNRDHSYKVDSTGAGGKLLSGISRAVLRLDGFVSADAEYGGGQFTTPPIRFAGRHLELNVATSAGGTVEVELLDEQGQPLKGYTRSDARTMNGNSVRMPVRWKTTDDVSRFAGSPIRLRFHMRDCKLYAFQFQK